MPVKCFKISKDRQLTVCDYEQALKEIQNSDTTIWLDFQDLETVEIEQKLDQLGVKGLAKKLCLEARDRPGFYPMTNLTFFVIPVLAATEDFHAVEHVAFLSRGNLILSLRHIKALHLQKTITSQDSDEWLPDGSIAGLFAAFMNVLSLESLKRTSELRDSIMMLEKKMEIEPDLVEMEEISHKRSELLTLESVVSGQMPVLQVLITSDRENLKKQHVREYLTFALANLQATDRSLDWLEGRIDVMRSLVDSRAQERTNRRLGRLTIVSVIFLPMTFLAGLWGMNFENMPGLSSPLGYPIALGSMFLISLSIYFYFRRQGWLD